MIKSFIQLAPWQSICIKPADKLQRTCYHQAGASDAINASWYRLDDSKVTSLQQISCNLRVSDRVLIFIFF